MFYKDLQVWGGGGGGGGGLGGTPFLSFHSQKKMLLYLEFTLTSAGAGSGVVVGFARPPLPEASFVPTNTHRAYRYTLLAVQ